MGTIGLVQFVFTLAIFFGAYLWLMTEKSPRYLVVLCSSAALLMGQVLTFREAFHLVNWNTLLVLLAMLVLVEALTSVGVFDRLAVALGRRLHDRSRTLFFTLCVTAGLLSMVINNITVMIFLTPLTLQICQYVPLEPVPLIIGEVCWANMIGAATLNGAPPNLMMAGTLGFGFNRVAIHMAPMAVIGAAAFMAVYYIQNHQIFLTPGTNRQALSLDRPKEIRASGWKRLAFVLKVDFETLLFFMGLFILVGALDHVGVFKMLALRLAVVQSPLGLILAALWISALVSALVDNIPMALAMAYLIKKLAVISSGAPSGILVWATLIGLTLGGNMTPIGASPNVVAYGILQKKQVTVGWKQWAQLTMPSTMAALLIASLMIWIKFLSGWY